MRRATRTIGLALFATLACVGMGGAQAPDAPKRAASPLCKACLEVCQRPLSYEDSVLDESTDSYVPAASRDVAKAAATELAVKLISISREQKGGHFGQAYESNRTAIEGVATKPADQHVSSAEIRSLKLVRAALYADTVVGLQAAAQGSPSQRFMAAYQPRKPVLEGVTGSLKALQQMRAAERLAVCDVLAAYTGN